jgi:gliding motility-associated-like protein
MVRVDKIILFVALNLGVVQALAQPCTTLGQNPSTAFPVCGATTFTQLTVPLCSNGNVPVKGCPTSIYNTANPYWYKFTCYSAGTLGFIITPLNTLPEDYDWQLFDITGHDPNDVFTDPSLIITANWVGTYGATGASPAGVNTFSCGSNPTQNLNTFAPMPLLVEGHEYLLLVSHFLTNSANEIGYTLQFVGGTASIVNPVIPLVSNAYGICDGTEIVLKLNKKINCSSIAADGSDFIVSGPIPITIASASGNGCHNGFDSDSIVLKLSTILSPGTYTIQSKVGSDGNTLVDNCSNSLATGNVASIKFVSIQPTPMDSISPVICIKDTLQLVFNKPMLCNSIALDGSDFLISGPAAVNIKSASGICTNGVSTVVRIILTAPIRVNGTFTVLLKNGSDGNSLIDECNQVTPAGSILPFTTKNITTADFQSSIRTGCRYDTAYFTHNAYGGTTQWQWNIDDALVSTIQNPVIISKDFGPHNIQLAVSNGICSDTARSTFVFADNTVKASFASADTLCPTDTLHFTDKSTANTISWQWNFGNGVTSTLQFPAAQTYPLTGRRSNYTARLIVRNTLNCADTTYKIFTVLASCYVAVPTAFTPNGDGLNDYLYPLNAFKSDNLVFRVFNRYGQIIFETKDWTKKWDGRVNSQPQPSGTYVWTLDYTNRDNGQKVSLKGTTVLIR